ncbi:hypothetical protein FPOA_00821 [Fusarium poae]|uniref:CCHC-type domain-containing protein n=1 Tax=Fusarium poae TaxID=36050 RepID=A0A1B8B2E0_FUSPO|nr:hypothetical protein FPOA_00821 [Fusarium poae]
MHHQPCTYTTCQSRHIFGKRCIRSKQRATPALTRAAVSNIVITSRGALVNSELNPEKAQRARELYSIFRYHQERNLVVRVHCCWKCTTIEHDGCLCEVVLPSSNDTCLRKSCGMIGHDAENCEYRIWPPRDWDNDDQGGDQNCFKCHQPGHRADQCIRIVCKNCDQEGHVFKDCPTLTCKNCGGEGHMARDCSQRRCNRQCGQPGYTRKDCPQRQQVVCETCQGPHPTSKCDTGREKAPKPAGGKRTTIKAARDYRGGVDNAREQSDNSRRATELLQGLRPTAVKTIVTPSSEGQLEPGLVGSRKDGILGLG